MDLGSVSDTEVILVILCDKIDVLAHYGFGFTEVEAISLVILVFSIFPA